jgi:hypothetical protein
LLLGVSVIVGVLFGFDNGFCFLWSFFVSVSCGFFFVSVSYYHFLFLAFLLLLQRDSRFIPHCGISDAQDTVCDQH